MPTSFGDGCECPSAAPRKQPRSSKTPYGRQGTLFRGEATSLNKEALYSKFGLEGLHEAEPISKAVRSGAGHGLLSQPWGDRQPDRSSRSPRLKCYGLEPATRSDPKLLLLPVNRATHIFLLLDRHAGDDSRQARRPSAERSEFTRADGIPSDLATFILTSDLDAAIQARKAPREIISVIAQIGGRSGSE